MPRIPLIWAISASNFPETLTPKNGMTLSDTSPLGRRGKANMTLNSTVSRNKMKDSVFYQMPKTATICRAPEGIQRRQHCVQTSLPLPFFPTEMSPVVTHLPPPCQEPEFPVSLSYGTVVLPGVQVR